MNINIREIKNGYVITFSKGTEMEAYHVDSFDEAIELITLAGPEVDQEQIDILIKQLAKQRR